ncbi:MAG: hypothetical protein HRU30_19835 [Rhodobacteraceae bacterium]|nr:hypothetical protein [Paracoccaceae bacterium]
MSILSLEPGDRFFAAGMNVLQEAGISLRLGTDFDEYKEILSQGRPGYVIGDPFDPNLHKLDETNSFWVVGQEADGKIMHTQAMRVLPLRNKSLGEYLRYGFRQFPPPSLDIDFERSRFRSGPGSQNMFGTVCYHGEYWISPDGPYRGEGWSALLGRMAFLMALKTWDPDYLFGFMAKPVAHKGFMARHGYMHCEPGALRWYIKGRQDALEGFLVYMSGEDLRYILELPMADLELQAA